MGSYHEKADPLATFAEIAPKTASRTWKSNYTWSDAKWMDERKKQTGKPKPFSVYEVHSGS